MTYPRFSYLLFLFCFAVGCGGGGDRVTGKVTFPDGSPLTVGKVMFTNGSISAFGQINEKGEYRMGTIKAGDGVPSGTYQVYIADARVPSEVQVKDEEGDMFSPMVPAVDPKFASTTQSGLTCEVSGSTVFDISVEKPSTEYISKILRGASTPTRDAVRSGSSD